jgi:hypothetical protein
VDSVTAVYASRKMISSGSLLITALRRGIMRSGSKWAESIKGMILERSVTKVPRPLFEGSRREVEWLCRANRRSSARFLNSAQVRMYVTERSARHLCRLSGSTILSRKQVRASHKLKCTHCEKNRTQCRWDSFE